MQLRSFKVQGFKNFRQPVELSDLGPVNVIHGPNNVGKSNLLQAIELFFFLLGLDHAPMGFPSLPFQLVVPLSDEALESAGLPRTDIFSLTAPAPIQIEAVIVTETEELRAIGLDPDALPLTWVRVAVELRWMGKYVAYTMTRFETQDGKDWGTATKTVPEAANLAAFAKLCALAPRTSTTFAGRFAPIPVNRTAGPGFALALYDARDSSEIEVSRRWDRFVEVMAEFEDILGKGTFIVTFDRRANDAQLLYQTQNARIPLRLLGSGAQQLATLLGATLVGGATIVGIEEPELNLRYTIQLRLREVLSKLIGGSGGLDQIFITSHSDAFETGGHFYFMEPTPHGPRVEKRGVEHVRESIGFTTERTPADPKAVLCYLSTDGVVRVPERIRTAIGLPKGGGVIFLDRDGTVEMMSDDTFADRFEPKPTSGGDHDA